MFRCHLNLRLKDLISIMIKQNEIVPFLKRIVPFLKRISPYTLGENNVKKTGGTPGFTPRKIM